MARLRKSYEAIAYMSLFMLTHRGRVTHISVGKLTIIGSDNGLSPGRRQAIIWTNAGILIIGALGTNVSEISIKICTFSLKKMLLKMSSGKGRPSCLNVLFMLISSNTCLRVIYTDQVKWYIIYQRIDNSYDAEYSLKWINSYRPECILGDIKFVHIFYHISRWRGR